MIEDPPVQQSPQAPLLTQEEFARHRVELERLRTIRDRDLPDLLRRAHEFVTSDAVEEVAQIQEDRLAVEARIAALSELLHQAVLVDEDEAADRVTLGRSVELEYVGSGRRATYVIAGASISSAPLTVSARSPVGRALMGRRVGDEVVADLPNGKQPRLRIISVAPA